MNLQEKIQKMIDLGFTYGQLGKICECSSSVISGWMRGATNMSKRMQESIEHHINIFLDKLVEIWK